MPSCQSAVCRNRISDPPSAVASRHPGKASVGPAADKSGDAHRHGLTLFGMTRPLSHPAAASARQVGLSGRRRRPRPSAGAARHPGGRAGRRLAPGDCAATSMRCCARRRRGPGRRWSAPGSRRRCPTSTASTTRRPASSSTRSTACDHGSPATRRHGELATLLVVGHEPVMSSLALDLATDETSNSAAAEEISSKFPTSAIAVLRTTDAVGPARRCGSAELVDFHVARSTCRAKRWWRASAPSA